MPASAGTWWMNLGWPNRPSSQHLKELKNAGLIQGTIEAQAFVIASIPKPGTNSRRNSEALFAAYKGATIAADNFFCIDQSQYCNIKINQKPSTMDTSEQLKT